jgi:molybdate transport system substrate-binding protein
MNAAQQPLPGPAVSETRLNLLCAGAAQGLVRALQPHFEATTGARLNCQFGAVGAMKEALLAGHPCDLMVLTDAMVAVMASEGLLVGATRAPLGRVRTGVAVRAGAVAPDVSTPDALRAALLGADLVFFPDPERATAGIHFAKVMHELGVYDALQARFSTHANGATAMRELGASAARQPIGCTQVSEILYTPGVSLVAALPKQFELVTLYSAAVVARSTQAALAQQLIAQWTSDHNAACRHDKGFEA